MHKVPNEKCDKCPFETKKKEDLYAHMVVKHPEETQHECIKCNDKFESKEILTFALQLHKLGTFIQGQD